jgi:hypothetical protein
MKPLAKFLSRNLRRTNNLSSDILYRGPAGRSFPGSSSILWSYVLWGGSLSVSRASYTGNKSCICSGILVFGSM